MTAKKEKSFEEAIRELEEIARKLESGELELEQAIKEYENGSNVLKFCEERLKQAKLKVDKIVKYNKSGEDETETFEIA